METFELLRKYLRFFGIIRESSNIYEQFVNIALNCLILSVFLIYFLTTLCFFIFDAHTFQDYIDSSFYVLSSLLTMVWYVIYVWQRHKYGHLFDVLNTIIETRTSSAMAITGYAKTNKNIERLSKMAHIIVTYFQVPFFLISNMLICYYKYFILSYSGESFRLIYPAKYPFNWKTPIGYLASSCIQCATAFPSAAMFTCTLILTLGYCLFAVDFILDIEENIRKLNSFLISKNYQPTRNVRFNVKKRLCEIIAFHSKAKEFTIQFSSINKGIIFAFLCFTLLSFCSLFLQINVLLDIGDFVGILQNFVPASIVIFWLYLFCHFGDHTTHRFGLVADAMYQVIWYILPVNEQKYLPLSIAVAQKGVYLQGFGSISCTRETFNKIIKTASSFFIVLRDFVA